MTDKATKTGTGKASGTTAYSTAGLLVLDLFSGIGGFSLGLERTGGFRTTAFCEIDPFCRKVLRKHWPDVPIFEDVRDLHAEDISETVDVITAGFSCQPASIAGKRRGTKDDRWLWPEIIRLIRELSPHWGIFENVPGLFSLDGGMVFEQVCLDLEGEGYEIQSFIIPACAVNAPHRRDRVWILAHSNNTGVKKCNLSCKPGKTGQYCRAHIEEPAADSNCKRQSQQKRPEQIERGWTGNSREWTTVSPVRRADDGLPPELDRCKRLKALGNSVVPQIPERIGRAIMMAEAMRQYNGPHE